MRRAFAVLTVAVMISGPFSLAPLRAQTRAALLVEPNEISLALYDDANEKTSLLVMNCTERTRRFGFVVKFVGRSAWPVEGADMRILAGPSLRKTLRFWRDEDFLAGGGRVAHGVFLDALKQDALSLEAADQAVRFDLRAVREEVSRFQETCRPR